MPDIITKQFPLSAHFQSVPCIYRCALEICNCRVPEFEGAFSCMYTYVHIRKHSIQILMRYLQTSNYNAYIHRSPHWKSEALHACMTIFKFWRPTYIPAITTFMHVNIHVKILTSYIYVWFYSISAALPACHHNVHLHATTTCMYIYVLIDISKCYIHVSSHSIFDALLRIWGGVASVSRID